MYNKKDLIVTVETFWTKYCMALCPKLMPVN